MSSTLLAKPSDGWLGAITLAALGVLATFGLWIQVIEATVLESGFGVLDVEFALTPERMDVVLAGFSAAGVLHLERLVGALDIPMTPGWSIMFLGIHVLGLRALRFLGIGNGFIARTRPLVILPLLAGACDTVENLIILHVLDNPATYTRALVPFMFLLVVSKFSMLFTSMAMGGIANLAALGRVITLARAGQLPEITP